MLFESLLHEDVEKLACRRWARPVLTGGVPCQATANENQASLFASKEPLPRAHVHELTGLYLPTGPSHAGRPFLTHSMVPYTIGKSMGTMLVVHPCAIDALNSKGSELYMPTFRSPLTSTGAHTAVAYYGN